MRYVPVEEARRRLGNLVQEVRKEPITISRRGKEQAILLSAEDYERLRYLEEEAARARFREALEAIGSAVRRKRVPKRLVDEALRAVRWR